MDREAYMAFTERLRERLAADERVVGLVALGSMAAVDYAPDEWSDHDFFVVVREGEQPAMRRDLEWLPDAERIVLSFAETEHGVKVVYDDGHLLEFAVFDDRELSLAKVNRYRVLVDRGSVERRMREVRAATVGASAGGARDDRWLVGQFLTNLLVGVGRFRRGERLSGRLFVASHAVGHLLVLLARHVAADGSGLLDDLDPWRRFDVVHGKLGRELDAILREEAPVAAGRLLDLAERELGGTLEWPAAAADAIRQRLQ
jgi:hypothetical protein